METRPESTASIRECKTTKSQRGTSTEAFLPLRHGCLGVVGKAWLLVILSAAKNLFFRRVRLTEFPWFVSLSENHRLTEQQVQEYDRTSQGRALACSNGRMLHMGEPKCNRSSQSRLVSSRAGTVEGERCPSARQVLTTKPYLTLFLTCSQKWFTPMCSIAAGRT